jgi:hypothetical protein
MKKLWTLLLTMALASSVWAETYSYTGGSYTTFSNHTTALLGSVGDYLPGMKVTGTFTTAGPLAANLLNADVSPLVTGYSFFDGLITFASTDSNVRLHSGFYVSTNASGQIIAGAVWIQRWQAGVAPHAAGDRLDHFQINSAISFPTHNSGCAVIGLSPAGTPDSCNSPTSDTNTSSAGSVAGGAWSLVVPAPAAVTSVPTLSEWGVIVLGVILAMLGMACTRRLES